ncbi:MAG: hypothetical protein AAF497_03700 [Planctomycetota bacterium]
MSRRMSGSLALLFALCISISAQAQDRYLSQIYGQGVHSYYRGNTAEATQNFTTAIDMGMNDPRPYYFRAIANLQSGGSWSAESDIRQGATLEVNGSGSYNIGRTLERIQGPARLRFEAMRRKALLQATRDRAAMQRLNMEMKDQKDLMAPPATPDIVPPAGDDTNPFTDDADGADDMGDEPEPFGEGDDLLDEPADDAGDDAGDDLFGDDAGDDMTDEGAGDDLFGDDAGDDMPAEDAGGEDDLFGDDAGAADDAGSEDDLFGDDAAADDAGGGEDDLFGDDAADGATDGDEGSPFDDDPAGDDSLDGGDDSLDSGDEDDLFGDLEAEDGEDVAAATEVTADDDTEQSNVPAVDLDDLFGN